MPSRAAERSGRLKRANIAAASSEASAMHARISDAPITIALSPSGIACPEKVISAPLVRSNARCMYVQSDPAIAEFMS